MQRWDDLTPEERQRYTDAEQLRTQLAAATARAEAAEAQLALVDRYGQYMRNAPFPCAFAEWLARRERASYTLYR